MVLCSIHKVQMWMGIGFNTYLSTIQGQDKVLVGIRDRVLEANNNDIKKQQEVRDAKI